MPCVLPSFLPPLLPCELGQKTQGLPETLAVVCGHRERERERERDCACINLSPLSGFVSIQRQHGLSQTSCSARSTVPAHRQGRRAHRLQGTLVHRRRLCPLPPPPLPPPSPSPPPRRRRGTGSRGLRDRWHLLQEAVRLRVPAAPEQPGCGVSPEPLTPVAVVRRCSMMARRACLVLKRRFVDVGKAIGGLFWIKSITL